MATGSARVLVEPAGIEVDVRSGETLFAAAHRGGLLWPTVCYGQAQCTQCHVRVLSGTEHQGPVAPDEAPVVARLARLTGVAPETLRLACRLCVAGDMVVEQPDVHGTIADHDVSSHSAVRDGAGR